MLSNGGVDPLSESIGLFVACGKCFLCFKGGGKHHLGCVWNGDGKRCGKGKLTVLPSFLKAPMSATAQDLIIRAQKLVMNGGRYAGVWKLGRQDSRQRILVVCSFASGPLRFKPPKHYHLEDAELVLQNYPNAEGLTLQPWECRVYLWK